MTTLEKVRRLEQYIAANAASADSVLDLALDKMLHREIARLLSFQHELRGQLAIFEDDYGMESDAFYASYEQGEQGDEMDFVEWAATFEMERSVSSYLD